MMERLVLDRVRTSDCGALPAEAQVLPETPERKILRSFYADARDAARALVGMEAFERSRHDRKPEMVL